MSKRIFPFLAWLAFLAAFAAWHAEMENTKVRHLFFNSDAMTIELLYRDVAAGNSLREWRLSGAPSFFPDMPVYFGLRAVGLSVPHAVLAFDFVFFAIMLSGVLALWRIFPAGCAGKGGGTMALAVALGCLCAGWHWSVFEIIYLLVNTSHASVFVVLPWALWLAFRACGVPSEVTPTQRLGILAGLGWLLALLVASDQLSLFQLVVPVVALSLWLAVVKGCPWRRSALVVLAAAVGAAAGLGLYRVLCLYPALGSYTKWTWPFGNADLMKAYATWLSELWVNSPVNLLVSLCFLAVSLWVAARSLRRRGREGQARVMPSALAVAYLVASVSNFGVLLIAGHREVASITRYQYLFFLVPMLWGWPLLLQGFDAVRAWFQRDRHHAWLSGLAVVVLAMAVPLLRHPQSLAGCADYYPEEVRCLDRELARRNLSRGVADYWKAKHIAALSHLDLQLVQVMKPDFRPEFWVNNWAAYRMEPEFFITNPSEHIESHRITPDMVLGRFGMPADWFACGNMLVLIYNRPTDAAFRALFAEYRGRPVL